MEVVQESFGTIREEAVTESMRRLGFERVTEHMSKRTIQLISELVANGALYEQEGRLRIPSNGDD